jgi:hypothetical protein
VIEEGEGEGERERENERTRTSWGIKRSLSTRSHLLFHHLQTDHQIMNPSTDLSFDQVRDFMI